MRKYFTRISALCCVALVLAGCSSFRNRENDYLHHAVFYRPPLKAAQGQTAFKTDPLYHPPKEGPHYYPSIKKEPNLKPPTL